MHILFIICFFVFSGSVLFGQTRKIDSLRTILSETKETNDIRREALRKLIDHFLERFEIDSVMLYNRTYLQFLPNLSVEASIDSTIILNLIGLGGVYQFYKLDSAIYFSTTALEAAKRINFKSGEAKALKTLGENCRLNGDLPLALEHLYNGLRLSQEIEDAETEAECNVFIGIAYAELGEYRLGVKYLLRGLVNDNVFQVRPMIPFALTNIGSAYQNLHMLDSALHYHELAASITDSMKWNLTPLGSDLLIGLGRLHEKLGDPEKAFENYRQAIRVGDYLNLAVSQYQQADLFHSLDHPDSSMYYAKLAYGNSKRSLQRNRIMDAARLLAKLYSERGMTDSAFYYQGITLAFMESLYSPDNFRRLQLAAVKEQQIQYETLQKKEQAEQEQKALAYKMKVYSLIAALTFLLVIALNQFRNNRQKQKANALLQAKKDEASLQREKAESALSELKSTQAQLIQSEKMASLGELTAGIAHEIQNPLNFINNFSEVNKELIAEMWEEIEKGNYADAKALSTDVKENEEKINHHGKRADAIVKGMLQHSRISNGVKEPTNINALADEYLHLAYYGLRAKDKSFNVTLKTHYDDSIGNINIVPQEIGRVILNLINNAFYAANEKKKQVGNAYQPTVSLDTKILGDKVMISVKDNGNGIPERIKEKIFQPFFTTKPTGQGTGLGLSLSYDIVKAHGGELKVETKEGEGSKFIIQLPV